MTVEKIKYLDCDLPKLVLSGPLSRDTMFSLHITGPWTSATARNLIKLIELQSEWVTEDETPPATVHEEQGT